MIKIPKLKEISLQEMLDACQAEAISNRLIPTYASTWRTICRVYAAISNTPLHLVDSLDPEFVLMHYFEHELEKADLDEQFEVIMDRLYLIEDPNYENEKKQELEDFIVAAEEEERQRLIAKKPIHKAMTDQNPIFADTEEDEPEEVAIPKPKLKESGFLDLSYLEAGDSEGSGFDDES